MFCNMPGFRFIDDKLDYQSSLEKLKALTIGTIYPGYGKPFPGSSRLARS